MPRTIQLDEETTSFEIGVYLAAHPQSPEPVLDLMDQRFDESRFQLIDYRMDEKLTTEYLRIGHILTFEVLPGQEGPIDSVFEFDLVDPELTLKARVVREK